MKKLGLLSAYCVFAYISIRNRTDGGQLFRVGEGAIFDGRSLVILPPLNRGLGQILDAKRPEFRAEDAVLENF